MQRFGGSIRGLRLVRAAGLATLLGAASAPGAPLWAAAPAADPAAAYPDTLLLRRLASPLTLDDCIDIAVARNLPLTIARHEKDAVRTDIGAALGTWLPEFTVEARRRNVHGDSEDLGGVASGDFHEDISTALVAGVTQRLPFGGGVEVHYNFDKAGQDLLSGYGGSLAVVQPLLRDAGWGRAVADVREARLAGRAEQSALDAELLRVIFNVKSAYYEVIRRRRLIEVNQRAIARDEQLLAFSEAKVEAKLATRRDVLSADIILTQDRDRLVRAETDHRAALDELADVLGIQVGWPLDVQPIDLEPQVVRADEEDWVQKARRDNPDIQRVRLDLERDALAMRVAGNARLPRLDLAVRYDEVRDPIAESGTTSLRRRERAWEGSVLFAYPLFNKPLGNAHRAAQIRYEQSRRLLEETERQLVLQVRDSARNLQRSEQRLAVLEKTIQGARDKVEFANVSFQLGRASNLDITDAQEDLVNAESDYVEEIVNHRVEQARLEMLLGGSLQ